MSRTLLSLFAALACIGGAHAEYDAVKLNEMLEQNAASAAHARLCDEDPMSDQLKATTMLVLALSGVPAENVQLGSAKFTDTMRMEMKTQRKQKDFDCRSRMETARDRLKATYQLSRNLREGQGG